MSSRLYAKYYFELRHLVEEEYNRPLKLKALTHAEACELEVSVHAHTLVCVVVVGSLLRFCGLVQRWPPHR